jgi:electron transport complex protein RnfB
VSPLAARIHSALPQTQCTRCGYPDCAAYAQAVADDVAPLNQCPPGGAEGVERLAAITGGPALPLNSANGVEAPRTVAVIDEAWCIGCTLCLPVCPTDAIIGSSKLMHTVIERHCTGCELCVPVCPVDCISLENVTGSSTGWQAWSPAQAASALGRYESHLERAADGAAKTQTQTTTQTQPGDAATPGAPAPRIDPPGEDEASRKRAVIAAALAQARTRRGT